MDTATARGRLVAVVRTLAVEQRAELERLKDGASGLDRPDFIWHYLLQSFSTMGNAKGSLGLIHPDAKANYDTVTYEALDHLPQNARKQRIKQAFEVATIRWPEKKAGWVVGCFNRVKQQGGLVAAKAQLLALAGRDAKIEFLDAYPGIGPKYARNIMMDVYHEDFRDSIALDSRIMGISEELSLSFASYDAHENFYLQVARLAGLNGWELDRLLFNILPTVRSRLGING
jgi:hypothetical protein